MLKIKKGTALMLSVTGVLLMVAIASVASARAALTRPAPVAVLESTASIDAAGENVIIEARWRYIATETYPAQGFQVALLGSTREWSVMSEETLSPECSVTFGAWTGPAEIYSTLLATGRVLSLAEIQPNKDGAIRIAVRHKATPSQDRDFVIVLVQTRAYPQATSLMGRIMGPVIGPREISYITSTSCTPQ